MFRSQTALLSLGSNIQPAENLRYAINALAGSYRQIRVSKIYQSAAVGFDGPAFLNAAVALDSIDSAEQLIERCRQLETDCKRNRDAPRFSSRTMDIDLVLLGDTIRADDGIKLPRAELYDQAFVLRPMLDIAANQLDPVTGLSIEALWERLISVAPDSESTFRVYPLDFQMAGG